MNSFRIAEITKPYTNYDMIQKHTSLPELAEGRTKLLMLFLNQTHPDIAQNELITVAVALVQLGLDTHDLVPINNLQKEEKDARSRQLKVLAGDYFSSRFYHILAQADQIGMIQQLSAAICEVNRTKMNRYLKMQQMKMTPTEYLEQTVLIKTQLFTSFEHLLFGEQLKLWTDMLTITSTCEVLVEEIARNEKPDDCQNSWSFWHVWHSVTKDEKKKLQKGEFEEMPGLIEKYHSKSELQLMLDNAIEQLTNRIQLIENESMKQEIAAIFQSYLKYQIA